LHNTSTKKLNALINKHGMDKIASLNTDKSNRAKPPPTQQHLGMPGNVEARRFSFRNYFFSKTKPSDSVDTGASTTSNYNLKGLLNVDSVNGGLDSASRRQERHLKAKSVSSLNNEMYADGASGCSKNKRLSGQASKKTVQSRASLSDPNCNKLEAFGKRSTDIEVI
jgi:hypothetical protein